MLAVLALFIFQNRKFKQRLLQLKDQMGQDSPGEGTRSDMQQREGVPVGELDITHYELTQRDAPKHEILGNEIHELNHNGIPKHELIGDSPPNEGFCEGPLADYQIPPLFFPPGNRRN